MVKLIMEASKITKSEKERLLDQKIENIRKRNAQIESRFEEIEADRKNNPIISNYEVEPEEYIRRYTPPVSDRIRRPHVETSRRFQQRLAEGDLPPPDPRGSLLYDRERDFMLREEKQYSKSENIWKNNARSDHNGDAAKEIMNQPFNSQNNTTNNFGRKYNLGDDYANPSRESSILVGQNNLNGIHVLNQNEYNKSPSQQSFASNHTMSDNLYKNYPNHQNTHLNESNEGLKEVDFPLKEMDFKRSPDKSSIHCSLTTTEAITQKTMITTRPARDIVSGPHKKVLQRLPKNICLRAPRKINSAMPVREVTHPIQPEGICSALPSKEISSPDLCTEIASPDTKVLTNESVQPPHEINSPDTKLIAYESVHPPHEINSPDTKVIINEHVHAPQEIILPESKVITNESVHPPQETISPDTKVNTNESVHTPHEINSPDTKLITNEVVHPPQEMMSPLLSKEDGSPVTHAKTVPSIPPDEMEALNRFVEIAFKDMSFASYSKIEEIEKHQRIQERIEFIDRWNRIPTNSGFLTYESMNISHPVETRKERKTRLDKDDPFMKMLRERDQKTVGSKK